MEVRQLWGNRIIVSGGRGNSEHFLFCSPTSEQSCPKNIFGALYHGYHLLHVIRKVEFIRLLSTCSPCFMVDQSEKMPPLGELTWGDIGNCGKTLLQSGREQGLVSRSSWF